MKPKLRAAAAPVSDTDYLQLSRLVTEAGWRDDIGQADTLHELFVDDGELIVPPTNLRGRRAIREWGRSLVDAQTYHCIRHVFGNMRLVVDGADGAEGTTVLTVFMVTGQGAATTLPWTVGEEPRTLRAHRGRLAVRIETVGRAIHATRALIDTIVQ